MIRVRFAPSPTGYLHVGGARTALFDWLFARKNDGKFVLRIEDTDTQRSTKESEESIIEDLKWCGLDWDEGPDVGGKFGPYRQSDRVKAKMYDKYVNELLDSQKAYYAVYEVDDPKKMIKKTTSKDEVEEYKRKGHTVTVNFKIPEGKTSFEDLAKGRMEFDNSTFDDLVIVKSNGYPTYNFAVVVDDHLMEISHVVRGEDHLTNTPKQIMIYKALGWKLPKFMHIPLILGPDKTPLSKRHGGTSVDYFRSYGIMGKAFVNYLTLLGRGAEKEIFDPFKRVNDFNLGKLSSKSSVFDYAKLEWVNGQHMRKVSIETLIEEFQKWSQRYSSSSLKWVGSSDYMKSVFEICRQKVNTFRVLRDFAEPFFTEKLDFDKKAKSILELPQAQFYLSSALTSIKSIDDWTIEKVEKAIRSVAAREDISKKKFFQIVRVAVLGKTVTAGLFESVYVLGKEKTISRIENVAIGKGI